MSVALLDRQHEDPRLAGALDDAQRMNVRGVLDSRREAPGTAQAEAAGLRDSGTRPRALTGNHRQPFAAEQFGDRFVAEIGRAGADGERRGHQHPAGGRVPVGHALDDLQRRDGSSSAPPRTDRGTHMPNNPSRSSASTTGAEVVPADRLVPRVHPRWPRPCSRRRKVPGHQGQNLRLAMAAPCASAPSFAHTTSGSTPPDPT